MRFLVLFCLTLSIFGQGQQQLLVATAPSNLITQDGTHGSFFSATCTTNAATSINVTAGHNIRAYWRYAFTGTVVMTLTGSGGEVLTNLGGNTWNGGGALDGWAYFNNSAGNASYVVTAVFTGTGTATFCEVSVTSDTTAATSDVYAASTTTSAGTPLTSATFTTAVANEIIYYGCTCATASSTMSAGTGYTVAVDDSANCSYSQYKIVSSVQTSVTATMNSNQNFNHGCVVSSFR